MMRTVASSSSSSNSSSSSSNKEASTAAAFGILGGFPGDQALLLEIDECCRALSSSTSSSSSTARPALTRIVLLLESLPHKGRIALVQKSLAKSPYRDDILRELFEYCFQSKKEHDVKDEDADVADVEEEEEEEDEFVLIGHPTRRGDDNDDDNDGTTRTGPSKKGPAPPPPLNLEKFHIFQVVIILLAVSGSVGAKLSLQYLERTASTKYRAKILLICVASFSEAEFSSQALWDQYQASSRSVQDTMIEACKRSGKRKDLLRRIYEHGINNGSGDNGSCHDSSVGGDAVGIDVGSIQTNTAAATATTRTTAATITRQHEELIYWLDVAYVAPKIHDLVFPKNQTVGVFKLKRWGALGNVYIDILKEEMQKVKNKDQLQLGKVWHQFRSCMELNSVQPSHVNALVQLLKEYPAYTGQASLPLVTARKHLEELSALGQDVSNFEGIVRIECDHDLLHKLSKRELNQYWSLKAQPVWDSVSRHQLFYRAIYSPECSNNGVYSGHGNSSLCHYLGWAASHYEQEGAFLQAWTDMYFRCKPSDLTDEERAGKSDKSLWTIWYNSYTKRLEGSSSFFSLMEQEAESIIPSLLLSHSRLRKQSHSAQCLLDKAVRGMEEVSSHITTRHALDPVRKILGLTLYQELKKTKVEAADSLIQKGAEIITTHLLPKLDAMMQFDPSAEETYINSDSIQYFESSVGDICCYWSFSNEVVQSIASMLLKVRIRADQHDQSKGFTILTENDTQTRRIFKYFIYELHQQAKQVCCELVKQVLTEVRMNAKFDASLLQQMWDLVAGTLEEPGDFMAYLDACEKYLPSSVFTEARQSIVERSRAFIVDMVSTYPDRWKDQVHNVTAQLVRLGLLESVLDCEDILLKCRNTLLVEHAGFGNDMAQQSMKDAMFVENAESRAEAITNWLKAAFATKAPALISAAMSFAASRLKNESGINRKTVFTWLETVVTREVIVVSLEDEAGSSEVHEALCSAIFAMKENDSCRLDSIGQQVFFPRLPHHILNAVLEFDPSRPCLERRQLWTNLAIRLHWALQKDAGGDENVHCYKWPLDWPRELESASWVSLEAFEAVYPPCKTSLEKIGLLKQRVNLRSSLRKDFDRDKVFGPTECVQMLEKAVDSVWNTSGFTTCALRLDGYFPEEEEVAEALCSRLQVLFRLCGTAWQEVELLTTVFDHIFSHIENSSDMHYAQASELLQVLFALHEGDIFPVPRLTEACDVMFRHAVAREMGTYAQLWLGRWQKCYLDHNCREFDIQVDDRLERFLQKNGRRCEPECWRLVVTEDHRIFRECNMARELLLMSTSALLLDDVRTIIFKRRQDVILRCVREAARLKGIFRFRDSGHDSIDELLYYTMKDEWLVSCHADVSRRYANWARLQASSKSRQALAFQIQAIGKFMTAPSTQHGDVLAALLDVKEAAVREALIHGVFSLDSPWHILGFVLSQRAIEKNDQRVTSALLGYVAKHVQVDKVVRVMRILLKNPRRKKLSVQLHKAVIRMLFDAKTAEAMQLLRVEWETDLPNGARILIVEKCMHLVAEGNTEGWEASVLSQVATSQSFELELKFCLFAPHSPGAIISIAKADGVYSDELLEQFQQKGPSLFECTNSRAIAKLRLIIQDLENSSDGALQYLAKLQKLALSDLFSSTPVNDPEALDDLAAYLTDFAESTSTATGAVDHKLQVGMQFVSTLFATGVCKLLHHAIPIDRHERTNENITDLCDKNAAAVKLRDVIQYLLNATLDLPIRKQSQRSTLLQSLASIMKTVRHSCSDYNMCELLIVKPFQTELNIIQKDASLLNDALASVGMF